MQNLLKIAGFLSLDVVLGTIAGGSLAVFLSDQDMPFVWWILLPGAVWVIYILDHQFDGIRTSGVGQGRRVFHYQNRKWLFPLAVFTGVVAFISAIIYLSDLVVAGGLFLTIFSAIHLLSASRFPLIYKIKEFPVSVLYIFGIWFGPLFEKGDLSRVVLLAILIHWTGAMGNLLLFANFERVSDQLEGSTSLAILLGNGPTVFLIKFLGFSGLVLSIMGGVVYSNYLLVWVCLGIIAIVPMLLEVLKIRGFYRIIGDAIFIIAGIPFILQELTK